jgi:transcriptional regulator with XRE-family HTH domain
MKTTKKQENYKSQILENILSNITKEEFDVTEEKMRLAIKIAEAIKAKGFAKKSDFAKKIGKQNSEISKWLSGTHNFTTETLILLQNELDIKIIDSTVSSNVELKNIHIEIKAQSLPIHNRINKIMGLFNYYSPKPDYVHSYLYCNQ